MKKYWYVMHVGECPVCGHEVRNRERVYEKPKNYWDIYVSYDYCLERDMGF